MVALVDTEDCWECSLLPPVRSLPLRTRLGHLRKASELSTAVGHTSSLDRTASASGMGSTPVVMTTDSGAGLAGASARLLSLEMCDFKCFQEKSISFEPDVCACIVGPNSSGKSSILDAIKFILLHPDSKAPRNLVRRSRPAVSRCSVTAVFHSDRFGKLILRREVILDSPSQHRVTCFAQHDGSSMLELSESEYRSRLDKLPFWGEGNVILTQFGLIERSSVKHLLKQLQGVLEEVDTGGAPTLKRRAVGQSKCPSKAFANKRMTAEAWVGRRLDEIYCELSRVPLDENYGTWGDGGQACLRRLQDGSFTIFVSQKRGLAAAGYGSPLESLSDGDHDLCALALLLILPAFSSRAAEFRDVLPPFVIFDDPDSRLDKRCAHGLLRLLSGPGRPEQCMVMSLNNHRAFREEAPTIVLPQLPNHTQVLAKDGDDAFTGSDLYGDTRYSAAPAMLSESKRA